MEWKGRLDGFQALLRLLDQFCGDNARQACFYPMRGQSGTVNLTKHGLQCGMLGHD